MSQKPPGAGTVSTAQFPGIFVALNALNLDVDAILAASGIPRSVALDPTARVDAKSSKRFWAEVQAQARDPTIGLQLGEAYSRASLQIKGLEGYLTRHSPTLRRVLENLARFARLLDDRSQLVLSEQDRSASVRYFREGPAAPAVVSETLFTVMHRFASEHVRGYSLSAVHLRRRKPKQSQSYERVFGVAPLFGQAHDELHFRRSMLDLPLVGADPTLGRLLEAHAEELLKGLPASDNLSLLDQLKSTIARELPGRAVDFASIARKAAMTPRTLRRRLAELGTGYKAVLDEVRRDQACHLLADTDASIAEITSRLGFASISAFQRAFARWQRCPPSRYRETSRKEGARK